MRSQRWVVPSDRPCFIGLNDVQTEPRIFDADPSDRHVAVRSTGRSIEIRAVGRRVRPMVDGNSVLHARVPVGGRFSFGDRVFEVVGPNEIMLVEPGPSSSAAGLKPCVDSIPAALTAVEPGSGIPDSNAWSLAAGETLYIGRTGSTGEIVVSQVAPPVPGATVSFMRTGVEVRAIVSCAVRPMVDGQSVMHARLKDGRIFRVLEQSFKVCGPGKISLLNRAAATATSAPSSTREASTSPPIRAADGSPRWNIPSGAVLTIGRAGGPADIALSGLELTHRHATVSWTGSAVELRSTSTQARPFVNGQPVLHGRLPVGGRFMIGNHTLAVTAPAEITLLAAPVISTEPILRFSGVSLMYRGRSEPTLRELSFELAQGEVLAVIGPSGAGKSTMCSGLLGEVGVASGSMVLGQANLAASRMQASHLVSFVPQQPAMFANLTVRATLDWVARLRLASDADANARSRRVEAVIGAMELRKDVHKKVGDLSGGQRKRVSTAMELLSDPMLLVLDEPTSGLDEGLDRTMMLSLRKAAAHGSAVIVVTHSMVNIDQADKVLALTQSGRLGYIGPPAGLLEAFAATSYAEVMDKLRRDVVTASMPHVSPQPGGAAEPIASSRPTRGSLSRHLPSLIGREMARQRNSLRQLTISIGAGVLLTALLSLAASKAGLGGDARSISAMLIAFIVCLTFFSMAQSFSAVVDDREVIEREARWSISAASMILARALACAPLAVILGMASVGLYLLIKHQGPPDPVLPHPLGLLLFAFLLPLAAMSVGLLISTVSASLRQAVFVLMGVLALQVVMTGLAPPFQGTPGKVLEALAVFTPSRWASAGLGADVGITAAHRAGDVSDVSNPTVPPDQLIPSPFQGVIWTHDPAHVATAAVALVAMTAVSLTITVWILRRQLLIRR